MERNLQVNAISWGRVLGKGCGNILGSTMPQKIFF